MYVNACVVLCVCVCCVQVLYREKDSPDPHSVEVVKGEGSVSLLLGALQKYTMYEVQVLGYTQMGDGPPSSPISLRTKEDGRTSHTLYLFCPATTSFRAAVCSALLPSPPVFFVTFSTLLLWFHLLTPLLSALPSTCLSTTSLIWVQLTTRTPPQPEHLEYIVCMCVYCPFSRGCRCRDLVTVADLSECQHPGLFE